MAITTTNRRARLFVTAVLAWIAPGHTAVAQAPPSNAPATCAVSPTRDTANEQGGVVVRFATAPGASASDALTAFALTSRLTESLAAILETSVRAGMTARDSLASLNAADGALGLPADDRWLIAGDVSSAGDVVSVTWRVIDARAGREVRSGRSRDSLIWLPRLTGALLNAVGRETGADPRALARATAALQRRSTTSRAAMEAYLTGEFGLSSFGARSYKSALDAFQAALRLDPAFTDAHLGAATAQLRLVQWGDSASARGRASRLLSAGYAVNRALALEPTNARALALLAQVHIARDEPIAAGMAVDALRRGGARPGDIVWLTAEVQRVQGDSLAARRAITEAGARIWGHVPALFLWAEFERRRSRPQVACLALNRLLTLDPAWGPAYVMRALLRSNLGDRRGGWADAELAGRLGRPEWGEAVTALIDVSMGEVRAVRQRARHAMHVPADETLPWLDALLRASVFHAVGDAARARTALAAMPCNDFRRRTLDGDPLLRFLRIPLECRVSRQPASTE